MFVLINFQEIYQTACIILLMFFIFAQININLFINIQLNEEINVEYYNNKNNKQKTGTNET